MAMFLRNSLLGCLIAVLLSVQPASAQRYEFEYYEQDRGLGNLTPQCLLQDDDGSLWVGTQNGLFRYDGVQFHRFGETYGIVGASVESLSVDGGGTVWVGTNRGLFRKQSDRFQAVNLGLAQGEVRSNAIAAGPGGSVFVGTSAGLSVSDRNGTFRAYAVPGAVAGVSGIAVDRVGVAWFWCGSYMCSMTDGAIKRESGLLDPAPNRSSAVLVDHTGHVWARSSRALFLRDAQSGIFRDVTGKLPPSSYFSALFCDHDNTLLVATDLGLARYADGRWSIVDKEHGLMTNAVTMAYQDRNGSLWLGLAGAGLARWRGYREWEGWRQAQGLANDNVWAILRDASGILWVGTDVGLQRMTGGLWQKPEFVGPASRRIDKIVSASDGLLWIGSSSGLLARYDGASRTGIQYGLADGLSSDNVNDIADDGHGEAFVATTLGLFRGSRENGKLRFERIHPPGEALNESYQKLLLDSDGNLLAGSSSGLWRRSPLGAWDHWTAKDGLKPAMVARLAQSNDGALWIGYREDVGLSRVTISGNSLAVNHITTSEGIASDLSVSLVVDRQNNVWNASDNGISRLQNRKWTNFNPSQGLIWNDCNGNSLFADVDNSIWIGTSLGLSHFIPRENADAMAPRVLLSSVTLGDERKLHPFLNFSKTKQRTFNAAFSSTDYGAQLGTRFRYRLTGLENHWNETAQRSAQYAGLPPGDYSFEVSASKGNGEWTSPAKYRFEVVPAWWQTWPVDLAIALAVIAGIYLLSQYRVRHILTVQSRLEMAVEGRTAELIQEQKLLAQQNKQIAAQSQEIERLLAETQQAMRYKSQFLATMSHEIRTPLNGVIGMLELSLDLPPGAEQRANLKLAQSSATSLLAIVSDILDFSKIEAGKLSLDITSFLLPKLLNEVTNLLSVVARRKSLDLRCVIDALIPACVLGDEGRLRQVLMNLLSNAVKFTDHGEIVLHVTMVGQKDDTACIEFLVRDSGVGIAESAQVKIFDPFEQADGSTSRKYGGTGLGLTIAKELVSLMGGNLTLVSTPGFGSQFAFSLPLVVAEPAAKAELTGPDIAAAPLNILVVEDNAVNRRVMQGLLQKMGHRITLAEDGLQAMNKIATENFDLAFVDIQMPHMDGLELARRTRERERRLGGHLYMVALTANAMKGDREECLSNGLDDYLSKPIDIVQLRYLLEAFPRTRTLVSNPVTRLSRNGSDISENTVT